MSASFFQGAHNFTVGEMNVKNVSGDYHDNSTKNVRNTFRGGNNYYNNFDHSKRDYSNNHYGNTYNTHTTNNGPVNNIGHVDNANFGTNYGTINQHKYTSPPQNITATHNYHSPTYNYHTDAPGGNVVNGGFSGTQFNQQSLSPPPPGPGPYGRQRSYGPPQQGPDPYNSRPNGPPPQHGQPMGAPPSRSLPTDPTSHIPPPSNYNPQRPPAAPAPNEFMTSAPEVPQQQDGFVPPPFNPWGKGQQHQPIPNVHANFGAPWLTERVKTAPGRPQPNEEWKEHESRPAAPPAAFPPPGHPHPAPQPPSEFPASKEAKRPHPAPQPPSEPPASTEVKHPHPAPQPPSEFLVSKEVNQSGKQEATARAPKKNVRKKKAERDSWPGKAQWKEGMRQNAWVSDSSDDITRISVVDGDSDTSESDGDGYGIGSGRRAAKLQKEKEASSSSLSKGGQWMNTPLLKEKSSNQSFLRAPSPTGLPAYSPPAQSPSPFGAPLLPQESQWPQQQPAPTARPVSTPPSAAPVSAESTSANAHKSTASFGGTPTVAAKQGVDFSHHRTTVETESEPDNERHHVEQLHGVPDLSPEGKKKKKERKGMRKFVAGLVGKK